MHFVGRSVGGGTLFSWECRSACTHAALQFHYAVLLQCQSVCPMQSCCSAKVYALSSLVAVPNDMQICCSAKVYVLYSLFAVPNRRQICCSAKVHAVLLQCQSVCSLVAVPKCMQICCSAGEPAISATRSVAISATFAARSQTTFAAQRTASTTARGDHFFIHYCNCLFILIALS
jgi:hypothetical protein